MPYDTKPMTEDEADAAYQVLIKGCGAHPDGKFPFVLELTSERHCMEYRFQGSLGFGSKFHYPRLTVDCYPENETPAGLASIEAANRRFESLRPKQAMHPN